MDATHDFGLEYQTGLIQIGDESVVKKALEHLNSNTKTNEDGSFSKKLPSPAVKAMCALRDSNPHFQRKLTFQNDSTNITEGDCAYWNHQQKVVDIQGNESKDEDEGESKRMDMELKVNMGGLMVRIVDMVPFMQSLTSEHITLNILNLGGTDVPMKNLRSSFEESSSSVVSGLSSLHLGGCGIGNQKDGVEDLIHTLKACQNSIKSLDLRYNDLCGSDDMEKIFTVLSESTVEIVHLEGNGISCNAASQIGILLCECKFLKELYLGSNDIGCSGAKDLAKGLNGTKNLAKLYIEGNSIGDEGAEAFESILVEQAKNNCQVLERLYFENNGINKDTAMKLGLALNSESMIDGSFF